MFVYFIGTKDTEKATAKQSDTKSDTEEEDEDEEKPQAAPVKKKCEPQICTHLLKCHQVSG